MNLDRFWDPPLHAIGLHTPYTKLKITISKILTESLISIIQYQ